MKIVLFSIFGYSVYSHGVFLTLAMLIGGYILFRLAKKEGLETKHYLANLITTLIVGIFASRLLYYFVELKYYDNFTSLLQIWQGGMISFGGFVAGAVTFVVLLKIQKQNLTKWLDLGGIAFPLAIAIGRIGCALNGEFGIRTNSIFAVFGRYPTTIFEIYLCLAIFAINFYLYLHQKNLLLEYTLFFLFVSLYTFGRIFIDSVSIDSMIIPGVNLSQMVSSLMFILSCVIFFTYLIRRKKVL